MKMVITDFNVAVLEGDSHLSKWIVEQRRLGVQAEYLELFRKYIPVGGVVVDAGACLGDHTVTYAEMVGPTGKVYAFEPNPDSFRCLIHNIDKYDNVILRKVALGAYTDFGTLEPKESERDNVGALFVKYDSSCSVLIVNLDSMQPNLPRFDFFKIDVEGAEVGVIRGASMLIGKFKPVILIELNRTALARFNTTPEYVRILLESAGYTVTPSEPHHSFDMDQIDALCIPKAL